jgi:hypothetical protein
MPLVVLVVKTNTITTSTKTATMTTATMMTTRPRKQSQQQTTPRKINQKVIAMLDNTDKQESDIANGTTVIANYLL